MTLVEYSDSIAKQSLNNLHDYDIHWWVTTIIDGSRCLQYKQDGCFYYTPSSTKSTIKLFRLTGRAKD